MSKKVYQQIFEQNKITVDELTTAYDRMALCEIRNDWLKFNQWNKTAGQLIGDLQSEIDAAYALQPVKSVAARGKERFWQLVNEATK